MFRRWTRDDDYFMSNDGNTSIAESEVEVNSSLLVPSYAAPLQVYTSARTILHATESKYRASWLCPVDHGFYYLVRLHFCEISRTIKQDGQRVFSIYINNQTADDHVDVFNWSHGTGIPIYRDYIVNFSRCGEGIEYLTVAIGGNNGSSAEYGGPILNGLEIFKLSDISNNLAGTHPFGIIVAPHPNFSGGNDAVIIYRLDGVQVEVSLKEIKGEFIPSLTTVKHSMDVSLCSTFVLSDDDEDDFCEETNGAVTTHIETKQKPEFESEFTGLLGTQTQIASTLTTSEVSPLYLYLEITEICRHAGLSDESTEVLVQQVSCFTAKDGLDQHIDYDSGLLQNMGRNRKSHIKQAKKLTRRTKSLRRRKSCQMGNHSGKQSETVIVEYLVSDNGIKNRNAIIKAGKELIGEDEASSSRYRPDTNAGDEVNELAHSDNWAEATACWEVGKVILQGHDDSTLMTQTLIIIWNVCGLGVEKKERCLRNLGRKFNLHILGILEIKLETLNDFTITAIWGRHPKACCSVVMNGRILHIEGTFTRSNLDCLVSFVYAPNIGNLKNKLWTHLVTFRDSVSKLWCLAGDFNEILLSSDRKGGSQITSSMTRFKICIDGCNLIELPLNGRKFTWSRGNVSFWSSITVSKSGTRKMVPALKMLKERCRQWSKASVGNMNNRIEELELEADSMDRQNECKVLTADELIRSKSIASQLKILYRAQESAWH
ncbi:hypothetical protein POTOM_041492 [Populus tomentosa]|uniref:Malectin-like domain-containing protein n=1 Tax=Populus tomentosa TaxID=118781 RepID=A0A8X8CIG8_POPTO|nr:hypothetical protein POTOM_041492 [Populus tomentosa]